MSKIYHWKDAREFLRWAAVHEEHGKSISSSMGKLDYVGGSSPDGMTPNEIAAQAQQNLQMVRRVLVQRGLWRLVAVLDGIYTLDPIQRVSAARTLEESGGVDQFGQYIAHELVHRFMFIELLGKKAWSRYGRSVYGDGRFLVSKNAEWCKHIDRRTFLTARKHVEQELDVLHKTLLCIAEIHLADRGLIEDSCADFASSAPASLRARDF